MTALTAKDNLLQLNTNFSGFDSNDERVEGSDMTYMTIKAAKNGQFWAFPAFPPNEELTNLRKNINIDGVALQLSINQKVNNETDEIRYTPILQNMKTRKTYYIYAQAPKQLATLFDKPYLSIASFVGDGGDWVFSTYAGRLLFSIGTESLDDEPTTVDIYSFELSFSNDKITAKLNYAEEKHIELK